MTTDKPKRPEPATDDHRDFETECDEQERSALFREVAETCRPIKETTR
jgi:hypothetical protein